MKRRLIKPDKKQDAAIRAAISADPDTMEMTDEEFITARRGRPPLPEMERKLQVTLRLDPKVIDAFRQTGKGWQGRINMVLVDHVSKFAKPNEKA